MRADQAERIAWIEFERGRRDVFTATGPDWRPVWLHALRVDTGHVTFSQSWSNAIATPSVRAA